MATNMNIPKVPTSLLQESDRAAEIPSSNDVKMINLATLGNEIDIPYDFLGLGNADCSRNRNEEDNAESDEQAIDLGKFLKEVPSDFLALGNGDCSRNRNKEDNPKSDEQAIDLGKLRNDSDTPSDFLSLGNGYYSRNRNKEDNPKSDEQAIDSGKLRNESDTPSNFLGLGNGDCSTNRNKEDNPKSDEQTIDLGKLRNDSDTPSDFLSLGNGDCSTNRNKEDNPKSDEQAIDLGKFVKDIDTPRDFLGLGIDSSSNYEINHGRRIIALNPTPLRSYHTPHGYKDCSSDLHQARASSSNCCAGKKRMREQEDNSNVKRAPKRSRVDEYPEPINPPQELVQIIGPNIKPVFLYRKQLSEWDTQKDQNRLFVNDRKKLMDFLTEEERLAVEDEKKPGIDLVGIDKMGREYELHLNRLGSLDKAVFNKGWHKTLDANGAEKGDWVHLWAFRRDHDGEFCLFVDFREQP